MFRFAARIIQESRIVHSPSHKGWGGQRSNSTVDIHSTSTLFLLMTMLVTMGVLVFLYRDPVPQTVMEKMGMGTKLGL